MGRYIFLIILSLVFTANAQAAFVDVCGNREFDVRDAVSALKMVESNAGYNSETDMNSDGKITLVDCVLMLKQLLSNIEKYNADAKYNIDTGVKAVINEKEFTVILSDTKAAKEFSNILPKTLEMNELNGNEKYIYLDTSFSSEPQKVGHINAGDIMLYGDNCIVIFYKSFDTPYSYTLIGHIDNAEDLAETVGSDDITAVFTN